ncbi:hypothetical protein [Desulfuromusa kysingii]|nr:hypothetical protein [Desulfuromusa kysingii]
MIRVDYNCADYQMVALYWAFDSGWEHAPSTLTEAKENDEK